MEAEKYVTLKNCVIVTVDDHDNYYTDGTLLIKNDRIFELGHSNEISERGAVIDMKGKIIMPGLINTHTHSPASLFRGIGDDLFLEKWLKEHMWPAEANLTETFAYSGASLSYLEYLQNGMTTNVDMWYFSVAVAQAAQRIGLRSFLAAGISTKGSVQSKDSFIPLADFLERYHGQQEHTRIYPCIGPHDAYSCSRDVLKKASAIAEKYELLVHIHLSETLDAHMQTKRAEGITPTEYMESCGIFEHRVLAAHCIHLEEHDMELFSRNHVAISYNPVSNLKLCDGILPLKKVQQHGINVTIGVDGAQSNNSLDLLSDIKTGSLIQKMKENDPSFFPAKDAIRMMTIQGAKALGMESQIGSLEKGKLADIIALDLNFCNLRPCYTDRIDQIYSHIVYSAVGANVSDVWVGGECLMRDQKAVRINQEDIIAEAQDIADFLKMQLIK